MFDVRQAHYKIRQMFLCGVSEGNQRYYFYNKAEGKVFVTRNGVFMEKRFLSKGVSGSKVQLEEIQGTPKNVFQHPPTPRRSIRAHRTTEKFTLLTME
jgi:hypothetical protein